MQLQYITDSSGNKSGVLLSMADWEKIKRELEEKRQLEKYKADNSLLLSLQQSIHESRMHEEGEIKLKQAKDLLNEL